MATTHYRRNHRISKNEIKYAKFDLKQHIKQQYLYEPLNQTTIDNLATDVHKYTTNNAAATDFYINKAEYNITSASNELYWDADYTTAATASTTDKYIWTYDDSSNDYVNVQWDHTGNVNVQINSLSAEEIKRLEIKERFKRNLAPDILIRRFSVGKAKKPSESRAREALLQLIGPDRFRRYLKNGFASIRGKSGRIYQIFPGHKMTKVWEKGQHIEDLCVVMVDSSLPPSDSVIMRMLMILDSEEAFRQVANVFPRGQGNFAINNDYVIQAA